MNNRRILLILLLLGLLLAACGTGSEEDSDTYTGSADTGEAAAPPPADAGDSGDVADYAPDYDAGDSGGDASGPYSPPASGNGCCPPNEYDPYKQPPRDNYFQGYGVNSFIAAAQDPLSTFSVDVDTAAYTVCRRYVQDGLMPPADAVRTEEFVNFFEQGYPAPDGDFGIYVDGAPSPFEGQETHILRIGIQGYEVPNYERKPANLVFVIDTSGSMDQGNRLGLVKESLHLLVERLRPDDTVAIVSFGTRAWKELGPTSGSEKSKILHTIDRLYASGSTNAEAGLQIGYKLALENFMPRGINRVILVSDGVANVGETTAQGLLEFVDGYAKVGITLTSMGFGMGNFNDVLMEQLADKGNGVYAYIDNIEEAERLFVDEISSMLQVIALNAKVQVEFNPEIVAQYRQIGYENREVADSDFRNDNVDAGEIGAGHTVTALYAVQLYPGAQGTLATVNLRWEDPDTRQIQETSGKFYTSDLASSFEAASPYFQLAVVAAQYAEILRYSPWVMDNSLESLISHAYRLAAIFVEDPDVGEFATLVSRAASLR